MTTITGLKAMEILDSRGRPTVAVTCTLDGRFPARASVPSGASTGSAEALELRDGDRNRYGGLGCRSAVGHVNGALRGALVGKSFEDQVTFDAALLKLDGTIDKSRLGANAILGVSIAFARAHAEVLGKSLFEHFAQMLNSRATMATQGASTVGFRDQPLRSPGSSHPGSSLNEHASFVLKNSPRLPRLTINLFSGGKHAGGQVQVQDVLVVPVSARSIDESLSMTYAVYQAAVALTGKRYGARALVADEGGLAPPFENIDRMLTTAVDCVRAAGLEPGKDVALAVDVASSHFYRDGRYHLEGSPLTSREMIATVRRWVEAFPIVSVEDALAEDDWAHWPLLRDAIGKRAIVLGDDLLCTNPARIRRAIASGAADALLLKVNQIGTLSEAAEACELARAAGWAVTVSARSGETEDDWLADLAVGWAGDYIKIGSITRSERLAKYNRLLEIESETRLTLAPVPTRNASLK